MQSQSFGQPSRVDEDERRAMFQRQRGESIVDLAPHLIAGHRAEFGRRNFDREIELASMPNVDNRGSWPVRACQKVRNQLNRLLCGRKSYAGGTSRQPV